MAYIVCAAKSFLLKVPQPPAKLKTFASLSNFIWTSERDRRRAVPVQPPFHRQREGRRRCRGGRGRRARAGSARDRGSSRRRGTCRGSRARRGN